MNRSDPDERTPPVGGAATGAGPTGQAPTRALAALVGLVAAAVALGVAQLLAALIGPASAPVVAVGNSVIAGTPEGVKDFAISTFEEHDKDALLVGTVLLLAGYAAVVGVVALRHRTLGILGVALFGLLGALAAGTRPAAGSLDWLPSPVGAAAGIVALVALLRRLDGAPAAAEGAARPALEGARSASAFDRRRFFLGSGLALGVAALTGGAGYLLLRRFDVGEDRAALTLPTPASPAPPLPAGADLAETVDGVTPLFSGSSFYRVDTALTVPQIRPADYRLTLTGAFSAPATYTLDDLYGRDDLIERDITLTCVSNEVGGTLAGSARWLGVPLDTFLRENGLSARSTQLVCRSSDGMTIGAPVRQALDADGAMLAIGMDGEPLPLEHGFPVRMVIPGLYGYVSACKWLTSIEATTFDAFDAYWVQRGWASEAPIKIASRIDTPGRRFPAGPRSIAGVAWAQTRGIGAVDVRLDDDTGQDNEQDDGQDSGQNGGTGEWQPARLAPAAGDDLWRQWVLPYDFAPGSYRITVRATTADGEVQTEERVRPIPSGATGLHSIRVVAT